MRYFILLKYPFRGPGLQKNNKIYEIEIETFVWLFQNWANESVVILFGLKTFGKWQYKECYVLTLYALMDSSFWFEYNKLGIVHCTYLGVSVYNK